MRNVRISAVAASLIGGAMLLFAPASASATALPGLAVAAPADTTVVEEVRKHRRHHRRERRYDRHRHGHRYRHRRPGFDFHYGGYYYASPWWVGPGIGIGVTVPVYPVAPTLHLPPAHVQWCMRYRTYDPATDTFYPEIGVRARCNSPYVTW
jgi:hypothetical protein